MRGYGLPILMWVHVLVWNVLYLDKKVDAYAMLAGFSLGCAIMATAWVHRDNGRSRVRR